MRCIKIYIEEQHRFKQSVRTYKDYYEYEYFLKKINDGKYRNYNIEGIYIYVSGSWWEVGRHDKMNSAKDATIVKYIIKKKNIGNINYNFIYIDYHDLKQY